MRRRTSRKALTGIIALLSSAVGVGVGACGSGDEGSGSGASGGKSGAGTGGAASGPDGGPLRIDDTGRRGLTDASACAAEVERGEPTPLDMYIMLDSSGSMAEPTGAVLPNGLPVSKWQAIASALADFLADPQSEGIGAGIQFFPLLRPGSGETCTTHDECGTGAPCQLSICDRDVDVNFCVDASDCTDPMSQCVDVGSCQLDDLVLCPLGGTCTDIGLGPCRDFSPRFCVNQTQCEPAAYASPEVPITPLPAGAQPIVDAMINRDYFARTPTAPALSGALQHSRDWAGSHPESTVITVLATDGLPTECTPLDIAPISRIAADGVNGSPSIQTFVIGVFAPTDTESPANLDAIARAGGTGDAFIVDVSGDVTQQFIDALNDIRGAALSCEFQVPERTSGDALDYFLVNVEFTDGDERTELVYVEDRAGCDGATAGWHYDADPTVRAPEKIIVCPDVCERFKASVGGAVNIKIGCQTRIR